jgi:hypothetical protein
MGNSAGKLQAWTVVTWILLVYWLINNLLSNDNRIHNPKLILCTIVIVVSGICLGLKCYINFLLNDSCI